MNEDYYHEQNSCYDYNSFGFDQFQPPQYTVNHPIFNSQNELLNSQNEFLNTQNELLNSSNKLMEQMTTLCDLVGQAIQKKEEEKRIAEEQAAEDRYWKIPICYDDDDDYTIAITPVLPTKEPVNSLSMGDEHLDTIPATESDEVIKSSVENLVPIPSESEGIPDSVCDVPLCDNPTPLEDFKDHSKIVVDSNDDSSSSDDDSFSNKDIEYVDASPPDSEIVSLEVVEIVIPEVGGIDTDILLTIKDDILREKLLNVNLLIAKIKALKDNLTPSSNVMTKSSSTSPNFFLEETNTVDNSLPETETFCFNLEEISSGSPTSYLDLSLPDYEAFYLDDDHVEEKSSGSTTTHADFSQYDSFIFDLSINLCPPADRSDCYHEEFVDKLAHIISPPNFFSFRKIFDPGIFIGVQSMIFLSPDEFSFSFICDPPLPVIDTLLPFSSENENKVVNTGILASEDKSPHSSSHRGFKASKFFHQKIPMIARIVMTLVLAVLSSDHSSFTSSASFGNPIF
ncbi:hypothetical protein Tco_0441699 [Tanacetum coccineum]